MKNQLFPIILGSALMALTLAGSGCGKTGTQAETKSPVPKASAALSVSNKLAAITAAGDPVTLLLLDQRYVEPPAASNAAPFYEQAFAAFNNEDTESPTFVADNIQALPLLLAAAEHPACRYPVALTNGAATLLPHLAKIKRAANFLKMVAINQTTKNRPDAATTTLQADIHLARSLDTEPILISKLVEIATLAITVAGLEQALTIRPFTDAELQSLQADFKTVEKGVSLRPAMVGERVFTIANFSLSDAELAKAISLTGETNGEPDLAAYRKTEKFQQDFSFALDFLSNSVAQTEMPYPQAMDVAAQQSETQMALAKSQGFLLSQMLLPALANTIGKGGTITARIRLVQVALAVERYRLKHASHLPALADLVPEFMPAIPNDPFDGQPLRYHPLSGKGYVVYSVGKNKQDDGGVEKTADGKTQLDLTFTVRR